MNKDKTKQATEKTSKIVRASVAAASASVSVPSPTDVLPARGVYTEEARMLRLKHLKNKTGADLSWVEGSRIGANEVRGNIENFIGSIEIPVAVAGPLRILFSDSVESVYAPIATTEGALVASITRGAKALSAAGGVTVRFLEQKITRAPLFELSDLDSAIAFSKWVTQHLEPMQKEVRSLSRYSTLEKIEPALMGRTVHVVFWFSTTDAAGQNMSTICAWKLSQWIKDELKASNPSLRAKIKDFCLEGGLSSDKKVSFRNVIMGRGSRVLAECRIPADILEATLKVTPEYLVSRYHRGMAASIHSGFLGYNINASNVVAGIFAATGQDMACVHESSVAQLHMEVDEDGSLYASYLMPNLVVGSVGGGLSLKPQKEMLGILNCDGPGKSRRLAEIIAAYALALDLSTVTSLLSGHFATAHERLGRKNDQRWLSQSELVEQYLKPMVQARLSPDDQLESITKIEDLKIGDSIVVEFSTRVSSRLCGFQAFSAKTVLGQDFKVFTKIKPSSEEILLAGEMMAGLADVEIGRLFKSYQVHSPFFQCETRELHAYRIDDNRFKAIAPQCFGVVEDHEREIYVLFEELLDDVELKDSVEHPERWEPRHLEEAIRGISGFHSIHYGKDDALPWIGESPSLDSMLKISEFLLRVFEFGRRQESWLTEDLASVHARTLETMHEWWEKIENHPKTWIHNDFNPRNVAFRRDGKLVAYDWELLTRHLPQRDVMEALAFVLESPTISDILNWCEIHRSALEKASGQAIDQKKWLEGAELALKDFLVHRLALYFLVSPHREVSFLPRVYRNTIKMIRLLEGFRETS